MLLRARRAQSRDCGAEHRSGRTRRRCHHGGRAAVLPRVLGPRACRPALVAHYRSVVGHLARGPRRGVVLASARNCLDRGIVHRMRGVFRLRAPDLPQAHTTQLFRVSGSRALRRAHGFSLQCNRIYQPGLRGPVPHAQSIAEIAVPDTLSACRGRRKQPRSRSLLIAVPALPEAPGTARSTTDRADSA